MTYEHKKASKTRVLIADDHKLVSEAVSSFIEETGLFSIMISENIQTALQLLESFEPDVMLLDIKMPGMEGLQTISNILNMHPEIKLVIFSGINDSVFVKRAAALGVEGFIHKTTSLRSMSSILSLIVAGEPYFPHDYLLKNEIYDNKYALNEVEIFILRSIADGLSNKEIAIDLNRNEASIKMHMRTICRKLGANNRSHAVTLARELSLLDA